jgi:regulator of replication initiation timing
MSTRERNLEIKVELLSDKNTSLLFECRQLRKKLKTVTDSRATLRKKYGHRTEELKKKKRRKSSLFTYGGGEHISRHKYDVPTVKLCLSVYLLGGCSFRGVVKILQYLRLSAGLDIGEVPCKSSIENWLKKCGHYLYEHPDLPVYNSGYALIIDECLVVGQERMLVILGICANKEDKTALSLSGAQVLLMEVKRSWTGEEIAGRIGKVEAKVGTKASYIVSDSGANLVKGIGVSAVPRIGDCGHEIARQMENLYKKEARLISFATACAQSKLKLVMMPEGYLASPRQRTIARFMNLGPLLKWAARLLANVETLSIEERKAYAWINEHRSIIEELTQTLITVTKVLELLKNKGLSFETVAQCAQICTTTNATELPAKWMSGIKQYIEEEGKKIPDENTVWHISSDIIEAMFGRYKEHKADNKLYGVTPFVLALPVLTKTDTEKHRINIDFKKALESTTMTSIAAWNDNHLIQNQVIRRRKALKV